ncbi:hypothetical protein C7B69_01775 [filamentous cyanobacterium Phorm 46]|nr:hypothetical protein C7B69_01775 [filamentous cyanobacterium Phorm 46]
MFLSDWLDLKGHGITTSDLNHTFQWQFAPGWEDMKEVNLFVSTFEIDPHDFYQPSLNLQLPGSTGTNFSDFYEPRVQVGNNVTWADNYDRTLADPNDATATPNDRSLSKLPRHRN